jgi:hypothetical protein
MRKLIIAFRNFANAPKTYNFLFGNDNKDMIRKDLNWKELHTEHNLLTTLLLFHVENVCGIISVFSTVVFPSNLQYESKITGAGATARPRGPHFKNSHGGLGG